MARQTLMNGDSGGVFRNKLNNNFMELYDRKFIPDYASRSSVLTGDGTWTVTDTGFVQRFATVTHPNTVYAWFKLTVNGVIAWEVEYSGLLSTGLYEYSSPPLPVKAGDVITTSTGGGGITTMLYFIPPA